MHGTDLGVGVGAPCRVLAGNPLICCNEIVTYIENCQRNSQIVPIEAKLFKLKMKHSKLCWVFSLIFFYGKAQDCFTP